MQAGEIVETIERTPRSVRYVLGAAVWLGLLALSDPHYLWWGLAITAVGEGLQLWAAGHLTKMHSLSVSGPYAHVRNPMYIGRWIVMAGLIVPLHRWLARGLFVVAYAVYASRRVAREERRLEQTHGCEFADYCASVRAWLPRLVPASVGQPTGFSWKKVLRNHEHHVALGLVGYYVLLYFRPLLF